jgi:hypothetical protein
MMTSRKKTQRPVFGGSRKATRTIEGIGYANVEARIDTDKEIVLHIH